jgi:exopolysaccharide production protein ExoQ
MTVPRWAGAPLQPGSAVLGQSGAHAFIHAPRPYRAWLAFLALVVLFAFMGPYSLHPAAAEEGSAAGLATSSAKAAEVVQEGSPLRRVAVVLLAGFAAVTLSGARRRRGFDRRVTGVQPGSAQLAAGAVPARHSLLPWLLAAYVGLAGTSMLWADDPGLTARRAVVFLAIAFAAYAVAQAWSLRDLVYFTIFANLTSLVLGIVGAIVRGGFTPFAPGWRFVGFANPNLHGIEAACLAIAAAVGLRMTGRRAPYMTLLAFALAMAVMSKSRTALAALVVAGAVTLAVSVRRARLATVAVVVVSLAFAVVVFAPDVIGGAHQALLLGRSAAAEDPTTLSGRTMLWQDLLDFVSDRPWLGYGFDSFWTPVHIDIVSLRRGWVITQAHSGYIESLLNVGWLGLIILVLMLVGALRSAIVRFRRTRTAVTLFAVAMLVWYMVNMFAEAVPESHVSTFVVMVILVHFALRGAAPDDEPAFARAG